MGLGDVVGWAERRTVLISSLEKSPCSSDL